MSDILTVEQNQSVTSLAEPGDHDRMAHYVDKDALIKAMIEGVPTVALCGKIWVPTRDGEKFPLCPECKEIYKTLEEG